MAKVNINAALSAQPSIAPPNPMLDIAIKRILAGNLSSIKREKRIVADQGCGRLRNLASIANHFGRVYLVDTEFQLERRQRLFGQDDTSIREYVERHTLTHGARLQIITANEFDRSRLELDAIFSICVFEVIPPTERVRVVRAAERNLRKNGRYVVIVARNDSTILERCTPERKYLDGYVFTKGIVSTFFRNFREAASLVRLVTKHGFSLDEDLSVYRHACLIFSKA